MMRMTMVLVMAGDTAADRTADGTTMALPPGLATARPPTEPDDTAAADGTPLGGGPQLLKRCIAGAYASVVPSRMMIHGLWHTQLDSWSVFIGATTSLAEATGSAL